MIYLSLDMANIPDDYELNEKDIESAISFLKFYDPENANHDTAIELLEFMRLAAHEYAHDNPKDLESQYEKMKKQRNDKS